MNELLTTVQSRIDPDLLVALLLQWSDRGSEQRLSMQDPQGDIHFVSEVAGNA